MSTSEEKTENASNKKLKKQRDKGSVSKAPNLSLYLGQCLAFGILFTFAYLSISIFQIALDNAFDIMNAPVEEVFVSAVKDSLNTFFIVSGPIFATVLISAILTKMIYQGGFVFSGDPMIPKLEKISPGKGFKRMFGKRGWIELGTSIVQITIWGGVFYVIFNTFHIQFLSTVICGAACLIDVAFRALSMLMFAVGLLLLLFAVAEGLVQKILFSDDQRMTKTERKAEQKEQMGSKEIRRERKRFGKFLQDSAGTIGADKATFAVYFEDMTVAIRFHPEWEPVPKLSAKARTAAESRKIRDTVLSVGYCEVEDEEIVMGMISRPLGDVVPVELHDAIVAALHRMFD